MAETRRSIWTDSIIMKFVRFVHFLSAVPSSPWFFCPLIFASTSCPAAPLSLVYYTVLFFSSSPFSHFFPVPPSPAWVATSFLSVVDEDEVDKLLALDLRDERAEWMLDLFPVSYRTHLSSDAQGLGDVLLCSFRIHRSHRRHCRHRTRLPLSLPRGCVSALTSSSISPR